jgi:hypothetical protein
MGIYVRLRTQRGEHIPFRDAPLIRLHYATEIMRFFHEGLVFIPENIEEWYGFPSETLGGKRKQSIEITDPFRAIATLRKRLADRSYPLDELLSTVIVINGVWDLNGIKLAGFFSINNNSAWRRVYRDIEIDAYGRGDIEDLVDALWKRDDTSAIISSLVSKAKMTAKGQAVTPRDIFFTIGVPVKGEVENLMAVHFQDRRRLIDFLYSTLSELGEQEIKEKMPPLDRSFFLSAISEHDVVVRRLEKALKDTLIAEFSGDSVTYIAKERNSFTQLYKEFSETVFKPAMKELPRSKDVKQRIKNGLEKMRTLV